MAWKDTLRPASFRGAVFFTEGGDSDYGRRTADHVYLGRDLPWSEDLGRRPREFRVDGYVLGDDYPALRDALIAAAETEGPGTLVHHYLGEMSVTCRNLRIRESTEEGGMARLFFDFSEAGERQHPSATADTPSVAVSRANGVRDAAQTDFAGDFDVTQRLQFVADDAAAGVGRFCDALEAAILPVRTGIDAAAGFAFALADIRNSAASLCRTPAALAARLAAAVALTEGFSLPASVPPSRRAYQLVRPYTALADFSEPPVAGTTPARQQQAANRRTLTQLVRNVALAAAAEAASSTAFDSLDQATEIRDDIAGRIDEVLEDTDDDDVFRALTDLRTAVVRDITARGADRTRLVTVTPQETQPALVLAWRLYGDATLEADIVTRNNIPAPGFVAGAVPLEVLARAR
jgi:prophage DNA circulation protein